MKRSKIKLPASKTLTFREVLRYLPSEMGKVIASPIRFLGREIEKQIGKEIDYRRFIEEQGKKEAEKLRKFWYGK